MSKDFSDTEGSFTNADKQCAVKLGDFNIQWDGTLVTCCGDFST